MNECVICKKEIKGYDVQYINGKYYHNCCIENLQSKIDKAIELNENIRKKLLTCSSYEKDKVEDLLFEQLDILKEVI